MENIFEVKQHLNDIETELIQAKKDMEIMVNRHEYQLAGVLQKVATAGMKYFYNQVNGIEKKNLIKCYLIHLSNLNHKTNTVSLINLYG
ncbi:MULTISPECIES: hypothetical protein [Bacillaceae]|uniref:Uncharacterized protein n=1 Tax=Evansella alkalicola TaxID=745819 RepID=A0ABS6JZX0_9BACI|nr:MULTISPECIES: hypothetical protein [Bacillaceae]MBU9724145.1 hypothetical protein [Bacillus alkalicola]